MLVLLQFACDTHFFIDLDVPYHIDCERYAQFISAHKENMHIEKWLPEQFHSKWYQGNSDGIVSSYQLYQPTGICIEFDNAVYFTNYGTASVKITSALSHTGNFLEAIGKLMKAYSSHKKGMIIFKILFKYSLKETSLKNLIEYYVLKCASSILSSLEKKRECYKVKN